MTRVVEPQTMIKNNYIKHVTRYETLSMPLQQGNLDTLLTPKSITVP